MYIIYPFLAFKQAIQNLTLYQQIKKQYSKDVMLVVTTCLIAIEITKQSFIMTNLAK